MSDEQQDNPGSSGSGMTSRLASLRASIRASKAAKDEAETTEHQSPTEQETLPDAPTVSSPTAISSSQSLPAVDLPDDEDDDDFVAEDTQLILAEDLPSEAETDEPPRQFRDSGENFITGDLHRVRPSSEDPLGEEGSDLLGQMDQLSDASDDAETSGFEDPTIIQSIEDLAFVQGTPLYMSPEQCRGNAVDPATDVYSLGVMMFELLEGFPPYVAETVDEVLLMHQDAPIPQQQSRFTPPEVRILLARMLAKEPQNRPEITEVIEVLQRHATVGADALGLEEESWSVAEVVEEPVNVPKMPPMVAQPMQARLAADDNTVDSAVDDKLPPIWLVAVIGVVLLIGTVAAIAMTFGGSGDEPDLEPDPEPAVVVADPVQPDKPPVADEPEPLPDEPEEPVEPMEFGAADVDAGTPDAGSAEDAGPADEPEVEEAPEPPKKKKKRRRRKRRKKPKKEELRELRLEL